MITDRDKYFFDLNGYLLLKGALSKTEVSDLNAIIDNILPLKHREWSGYVHSLSNSDDEGQNLQQVYEAGEPFEKLIDHPSWIDKVKYFVGGEGTFDYASGSLFIDENFVSIRGPGQAISLHSGGHTGTKRTQYRYYNGRFQCGQVNILMALTDIGEGDGATMVIPGSHKSHFPHPDANKHMKSGDEPWVDNLEGAIEVHMDAGDAILFVDAISHGSAKRTNRGNRRIAVYRYGPSWGNFRHGYQVSSELLERLTPERRKIVQPRTLIPRTPQK